MRSSLITTLCFLVSGPLHAQQVTISPSFETAGVDLEGSSGNTPVKYRKVGDATWIQGHPAVRYDGNHAATTLFDLVPSTKYELEVGGKTHSFTTRNPFTLPAPTKTVNINAGDSDGLRAALKAATPGVEIRIPKGNYSGGFSISKSGTAQNPIVISGELSAADKGKPIEQRSDLPKLTHSGGTGFTFQGAGHVVLQNVKVANANRYGVHFDSAHHCVLQHSQVYDNDDGYSDTSWSFNVRLTGGGATGGHNLVQFNHVADTDTSIPFDAGDPWSGTSGVTYFGINNLQNSGPGNVIRGNRVEGHYDCIIPCPDESDNLDPGEGTSDAKGSHEHAGFNVEIYDNTIHFCRDDGIESDGFCINARIYRNTISKVNNGISIAPALPGPFFWVRNRVRDFAESAIKINTGVGSGQATIRNHYFYHNTFSKAPKSGYLTALGGGSTSSKLLFFKNNIFYSLGGLIDDWGSHVPQPEMNGNLWYSTGSSTFNYGGSKYSDFSSFQSGSGQEGQGKWGDPQLNSTSLDIAAGSPAVDSAMQISGINHIFGGSGPDIGAHEIGKPQPPPPPPPPPPTDGTPRDLGPPPTYDSGAPIPGLDGMPTTNSLEGGCSAAPRSAALSLLALLLLCGTIVLLVVAVGRSRG